MHDLYVYRPYVFNGVKVGRISWPKHGVNIRFAKSILGVFSRVNL